MSTLVIDRLDDDTPLLVQEFYNERPRTLAAFRLCLYVHNMPAGQFLVMLSKDGLPLKNYSFTSASIKASTHGVEAGENYFWVDFSIPFSARLEIGTYQIKVGSVVGYTPTEDSFIGWLKDWQNLKRNTIGTPNDFSEYPYSYNLVEYAPREL